MGTDSPQKIPPGVPQAGAVVMDKYRIERLVGTGGMAHVVAATHTTLGQAVAIKFLDPDLLNDGDALERFSREARAMATLSSKHTVRVLDIGAMPDGLPFMVMDLLEGNDLHKELQEKGPLPMLEACEYIDQACDAVAEAHAAGIIHRDLKPQNLFLTKVKNKPVIRVLDFGIARSTGKLKLETITRMGDMIGTLQYMSPEQVRSSRSVDPRSDVWSLGACLYKLLTGYPPFPQAGEAPLMSAILTSAPKPMVDYRKDVPAVLSSVIMRCLRKAPEERFQTVKEFRKALDEATDKMTMEGLNDHTDVMSMPTQAMVSPALDPDAQPKRGSFARTVPLDAAAANRLLGPQRASQPSVPRAAPPSQPTLVAPPALVTPPMARPPSHPSYPKLPRNTPTHRTTSPLGASASVPLSFAMIVVAVAVGVFLAGLGLFAVLSRHR